METQNSTTNLPGLHYFSTVWCMRDREVNVKHIFTGVVESIDKNKSLSNFLEFFRRRTMFWGHFSGDLFPRDHLSGDFFSRGPFFGDYFSGDLFCAYLVRQAIFVNLWLITLSTIKEPNFLYKTALLLKIPQIFSFFFNKKNFLRTIMTNRLYKNVFIFHFPERKNYAISEGTFLCRVLVRFRIGTVPLHAL